MKELLRPWKLVSFAAGLAVLIAGAFYFKSYEWDVGVSLIMGLLTYLTAPWALRILRSSRWRMLPAAIFFYWFTVDGSYVAYNALLGHPVSTDLRCANFFASTLLYFLCGWLWLPQMNLKEILLKLAIATHVRRPGSPE